MTTCKTMLLAGLAVSALIAPHAHAQDRAPSVAEDGNGGSGDSAPQEDKKDADQSRPDDVIVRGFRANLDEAYRLRRDNAEIVDYLPLGDINQLASTDIADALEFIPGVVGTRYRGTVETISLRGLPNLLTLSTIDGRVMSSKQGTRSVYMKLFPSDFFTSAAVYKSSAADLTEGGIAGTVVLSTPDPLSQPEGLRMSGQLKETPFNREYRLSTDENGSRINIMGSKRFDLGGSELGITLGFNYMNDPVTTAQQYMSSFSEKAILGTNAIVPATLLYEEEGEKYKRTAGLGVIEWQSTSGFSAKLDAIYSNSSDPDQRNFLIFTGINSPKIYKSATFSGGALETANVTGIGVQNRIESITANDDVYMVGGNLGYEGGGWDIKLDVYRSKTTDHSTNDRPVLSPANVSATLNFADDGFHVSNISTDLSNPAVWGVASYYASNSYVHDMVEAAKLDGVRAFDGSWLNDVAFGGSYTVRHLDKLSLSTTNSASAYPTLGIGKIPASVFTDDPYMTFNVPEIGGLFPSPFALVDHQALLGVLARPVLGITDDSLLASENNTEKTWAGYIKADFGGEGRLRGNVGVRVVNTRLTARGYTGNMVLVTNPKTDVVTLTVDGLEPATERSSYTEVLPTLNLRYEITPHLQARLAAGRAMARPDFDDQRLSQDLNGGDLTLQPFTGTAGNPQLKPIMSDQVDAGFEWFPSRHAMLAVTGYFKRVSGLVETRVRTTEIDGYEYQLSSPVNASAGDVYGVEAQGRFDFNFLPKPLDGFGVTANVTWNGTTIDGGFGILNDTDANGNYLYDIDNRNPGVEGFTKLTATGVLFYEKGPVGVRLAARYADDHIRSVSSLNAPVISRGGVQLDASATFRLSRNLRLQVQATNLTERNNDAYYLFQNYYAYYQQNGRTFFFGFDANF